MLPVVIDVNRFKSTPQLGQWTRLTPPLFTKALEAWDMAAGPRRRQRAMERELSGERTERNEWREGQDVVYL
jgi:hypothetical protein